MITLSELSTEDNIELMEYRPIYQPVMNYNKDKRKKGWENYKATKEFCPFTFPP